MNPEIYLTPEEKISLANSGDDAAKSLYQQGVSGAITLESCKWLTPQEQDSLLTSISADKFAITAPTKTTLLGFLAECKKSATVTSAPITTAAVVTWVKPVWDSGTDKQDIPAVTKLADEAKQAMDLKIKTENPDGSHLSNWRALWKFFPWTEPTIDPNADDIKQVINQSREWNTKLVDALVKEYQSDSTVLPVNWFSRLPGWFPTLKKNHNFNTDGYAGKHGAEAKRAYITDTLVEIKKAWEDASVSFWSSPTEWGMQKIADLAVWGLLPLASTMWAWRMAYNMAHNQSIKKPQPGEAAMWTWEKIWDGSKWVARKWVALWTLGAVKLKPADKTKATSDTPAYTAEQWATERARLEETTRRMIYMDSGVNPRHNPNATPAEIFRDVESTPALKTAYDARMVKLTELGNTLVWQEKYLSLEAFNREAWRIVAWDIGESSITKTVLKRVPFTAERSDYKQTQAALKKVKWEIDTMRARLSAKSMMDGVEIPKVLEAQFLALENAHKAAYEADLALDKSRNQIARTIDRINAINDVIAHFEEIADLQAKIDDPASWIKKKIQDLEGKITSNTGAAHSENPAEQRQREAEAKQVEIDAAKSVREQAIRESDAHDLAKKEALKDKRNAEQAVISEEARIRKDLTERQQFLTDEIAKYPAKIAAAKALTEKTALGNEKTALEDELNGKKGKVKALTEELTPPHTGPNLVVKKQAAQDALDAYNDLITKDTAVQRKISDADAEWKRLSGEKTIILRRSAWVDAKSLTTTDQAELEKLKQKKWEIEGKIKDAKAKIDALASTNKGFPRSTGGSLAIAQAELARLDGLIAPGGALDTAKTTAKAARNAAFTHMNTTITALNTESVRLGAWLEIKVPHIAEFKIWQGFSEELSMRENGATGDKAADHKLKWTRPKVVESIIKRK